MRQGRRTRIRSTPSGSKLASDPLVKSIDFVPKAEALERMRKLQPEIVENLPGNPLPDAFEVAAHDGADVKAISRNLRAPTLPPGVEKINDGGEVSDRVVTVARVLSTAFAIATIILLISSALLIANTIRLSIFSRRREIEVMKLVGATNWFVRGPFMLEGLICGVARVADRGAPAPDRQGGRARAESRSSTFDAWSSGVEPGRFTTISLIVDPRRPRPVAGRSARPHTLAARASRPRPTSGSPVARQEPEAS